MMKKHSQEEAFAVPQGVDQKEYNRLILSKIEHSLNIIIPVTIPLVLLMVINDYLRSNSIIMYIDLAITVSMALLTVFRKRISNKIKIAFMALLTIVAGFTSLVVSGYAGAGFLTLLIGSMLITGFLSKRSSVLYALLLSGGAAVFIGLVHFGVVRYDLSNPKFDPNIIPSWINLLIVFIISLLILIVIINVIKKYFGMSLSKTEEQLNVIDKLAFYDSLTGLPNKNKLLSDNERLSGDAGILALFSLDGYSLINSIYGEDVTNEIIIGISELLEARKDQFLQYARTDANEFAFVWKKGRMDEFLPFVQQSIDAVQKHARLTKWKRGIHIHLGYFECSKSGGSFLEAYQKAKIALQDATANQILLPVKYDETMEARIRAEYDFRQMVDDAILSQAFTVVYQEKVDSESQQVVGVEALSRWNSKELGPVSPGKFIPVIEKSTLYSVFGNQVIRRVLDDYPKLCETYGPDIKVSINVSPQHLQSQDLISYISDPDNLGQAKPENIMFEITEEMLIDNIDYALTVVKDIKKLGFQISLDDFGSGYSSLSYLSRLIFDEVKIDRSFIDQITTDSRILKIIGIIASLKDVYGFAVVAEGVETQEQYDLLKSIGHFIIQGYYFAKPKKLA